MVFFTILEGRTYITCVSYMGSCSRTIHSVTILHLSPGLNFSEGTRVNFGEWLCQYLEQVPLWWVFLTLHPTQKVVKITQFWIGPQFLTVWIMIIPAAIPSFYVRNISLESPIFVNWLIFCHSVKTVLEIISFGNSI